MIAKQSVNLGLSITYERNEYIAHVTIQSTSWMCSRVVLQVQCTDIVTMLVPIYSTLHHGKMARGGGENGMTHCFTKCNTVSVL